MTRADGLVDPYDAAEVEPVLAAALRAMGSEGIVDLLVRLPGARVEPAQPKRFLRAAEPGRVSLGAEQRLTITDPMVHEHVVGGIVLSRDSLPTGRLPVVLARLLAEHARREGVADETAVALSALSDATGSF